MRRQTVLFVEAPYSFTILGCDTLDSCLISIMKVFCSADVLIFLTATTLDRQTPL
jgi:hypothetical protein